MRIITYLPASTLSGLAALVGIGAIGGALAVRKPKKGIKRKNSNFT